MQIIYSGIKHLSEALKDSKKVLLVCDSSFPFLNIKEDIEGIALPYTIFDDFTPNPLYEDVCKGIKQFNAKECDTIIAVGGGSSIDVAKCIKLYCKMSDDRLYLEQEYKDTGVKLIAIPTTAGTGSESTRYAVIYYDGKKQSVTHESIIPDVAILEPEVLKTLPLYQKKATMCDALCHAIESYWSVNSTEESKAFAKSAIAGVLAMNPRILILDEPTAGLDPRGRDEILGLISEMKKKLSMTIILVSHSMDDVARYVERIVVMGHGKKVFDDTPRNVFKHYIELEDLGLSAPQITYIMNTLRDYGMDVHTDALTVEEAAAEILRAAKRQP